MTTRCESFRSRLCSQERMIGTFQKTPSPIISEVLGLSELDLVCVDTEHAPFGRYETDQCVAALRAADLPSLVRVANDSSTEIRNALDCGATGVLVPHVTSAKQAARIVSAAHFGDGGRGYAGSTRAAGYTIQPMSSHLTNSAEETTVVVQIEDLLALDNVSEIAAVSGIDAIFIGRIDLAVALQKSAMDEEVVQTVKNICTAAAKVNTPIGMFTPEINEIPMWSALGTSFYLLSSEHSMILAGANALAALNT